MGSFEGDPIASQDSLTDIAISSSKTTTTSNTPHKRKSTASPNSRGPQRSSIEASSLSRLQSKMSPAAVSTFFLELIERKKNTIVNIKILELYFFSIEIFISNYIYL